MSECHLHMDGTAWFDVPPDDVASVNGWLTSLVDVIAMERLDGPFTVRCEDLGNEGVTGVILITTSHASIHIWPLVDKPFAKFDVFSCREFKPGAVVGHLFGFGAITVDYTFFDRSFDAGIKIIDSGTFNRDA